MGKHRPSTTHPPTNTLEPTQLTPTHSRPLAALEDRASGAIGSILGYFRRDEGVVWKQARAPVDALETPRAEFVPVRRGDKKRAEVPAVGRTILLPKDVDMGGVN